MDTYTIIYNMYERLNLRLLSDLDKYCRRETENEYNLEQLIERYSKLSIDNKIINHIEELNNDNSISSMTEYYDFIDIMIEAVAPFWYEKLTEKLTKIKTKIEDDTWAYLEHDAELPDIKISYNGITTSIPLGIAEINEHMQGTLKELTETIEELYKED